MVTGMCVQQFKSISLTDDICLDVSFVLKLLSLPLVTPHALLYLECLVGWENKI